MPDNLTPRQRYLRRWNALKTERTSWLDHWRELSDYLQPRRSRFLSSDRNKSRRNDKLVNSTPLRAVRILASGMMAGLTSKARPWFRLTVPDARLAEQGEVKAWLRQVEERLREIFARSNIYSCLARVYVDLAVFGTAVLHIDEDVEDVLRGYVYPVGQYALAASARQQIDTVYRELSMTVAQLVEKFGLDACSQHVRDAYERGDLDQWREVLHIVEPNRNYQHGKAGPAGMRFRSCWLEMQCGDHEGFLRESGYEEMPTICPRWETTGEDVYGNSPGMVALSDSKSTQKWGKEAQNVVGKIVRPPMNVPSSFAGRRFSLLEGDVNYVDATTAGMKAEPSITPQDGAAHWAMEAETRAEQRVNEAFMADLWLLLATSRDDPNKTATEITALESEKMIQLGPVYENLDDGLLDPLMERSYALALRNGEFPPPPEELRDMPLRVEYISPIAQAQKMLGVVAIDRYVGFIGNAAGVKPAILDNLNEDEAARLYADALGVPPQLANSADRVQQIRAERAQQQQQQAMAAQAQQEAATAKDLAAANTGEDNVLNRLMTAYGAAGVA